MKKLICGLVILSLVSCSKTVDRNTEETICWIEKHKKPIQVETFIYDKSNRVYTLFSADGKVCATGTVALELPPLIQDSGKTKYDDVIRQEALYQNNIRELERFEIIVKDK